MELQLLGKTTIRELKRQFSKYFPLLKIEFFKYSHSTGEASGLFQKLNDDSCVSESRSMLKEGKFSFQPSISVGQFEQQIQKEFGLSVQVFRKVGEVWIETTQTDHLSLEKQNAMAQDTTKALRFNINTLFL